MEQAKKAGQDVRDTTEDFWDKRRAEVLVGCAAVGGVALFVGGVLLGVRVSRPEHKTEIKY